MRVTIQHCAWRIGGRAFGIYLPLRTTLLTSHSNIDVTMMIMIEQPPLKITSIQKYLRACALVQASVHAYMCMLLVL